MRSTLMGGEKAIWVMTTEKVQPGCHPRELANTQTFTLLNCAGMCHAVTL